jgi:ADP-heptose:LPS heptosyltransferase
VEILLIHPGGLGDIILALPAIALLRDKFPSARLTIAANLDHVGPIMGAFVERAVSLSTLPLHNLYSENTLLPPDVRFWRSFDRIISWTGAGDAGFVRRMKEAHPSVCIGSWRPGPAERRHVAQLFVDSLGPEIASGMNAASRVISLESGLSAQGLQWLKERNWDLNEPLIAMHPGAGSKTKRWPLTRFISLAKRLAAQQNKLLIVEGPAELGLAAQIARELPAGAAIPAPLPLDMLGAAIAQSKAFVGNDSGIAHLAAALGIPAIVIFGPTLPQHWAPLGPNVWVLRDCSGCEACLTGEDNHTCLDNITAEDVIRNLKFEIRNS